MRRTIGVLMACLALGSAGCGSGDSAQGESVGDDEYAGERTRDAGSAGEQISAEDVSELEKLREQVAAQCDGGQAPRLRATVDTAIGIAAQSSEKGIVDLSQIDRAPNIRTYLTDMAGLLDRCGAPQEADRLRAAEYGTAL
jgi:hypothetical protein